jgi:hypothetical protein
MKTGRGGPRGRAGPGGARPAGATLASLLAAAAALAALCSCGMETVKVYSAPTLAYSGGLITLTHNSANDAEASTFLGYELYYRAYQDSAAAETDRSALATFINTESTTPETCIARLESLKFHRVYNYQGKDARPLFGKTIANVFHVYLSPSLSWYVDEFSRTPTDTSPVYRAVSSSSSLVAFNSSDYDIADADYSGSSSISSGTVYFVFFATAYGFDFSSNLKEVVSLPTGLDSVITFAY